MAFGERVVGGYTTKKSVVDQGWRGSNGGLIELDVDGELVTLEVDRIKGPKVYNGDGSYNFLCEKGTPWLRTSSGDQKLMAYKAARMNTAIKEVILEQRAIEKAKNITHEERIAARCQLELQRTPLQWQPISFDTVQSNHNRVSKGVFYGIEFPWSEATLQEMGPAWLTRAFHAAGTMDKDNEVTEIKIEKQKITAGNNAGKFLFEVKYKWKTPDLHTKLFAKIPFPLTGATQSDRLSSSVNKQPMDFFEINTYRIFEDSLPCKTPKFYFGDVSNTTSNYILITECIAFAGMPPLKALQIEGPYVKCKDFELGGTDKEHYLKLMKVHASIAAAHKTGRMGDDETVSLHALVRPSDPSVYGMKPDDCSGQPPQGIATGLKVAISFFADTAKHLYPEYVTSQDFQNKFFRTMMTGNAYAAEITYWKHSDPDYVSLGHQNLNMDNAYFWRDSDGHLDCGVFDWGGFGASSLAHRIYWCLNCSEYDQTAANLDEYLEVLTQELASQGGPRLSVSVLRMGVILTALENMQFMVASVPNSLRQCPKKEFATIRDRHDPRIADDVGGKSTLRTTLHCLLNGIRVLEELHADEVLESWIQDVYVGSFKQTAKTEEMIFAGESL
eukprot:TRINITY_DN26817_c0_g1_i1.p1 TRINITY_DN26817_c0_g1~~TRINITY_DN26817_c0_g1_i1.p1  ORF type:complete len:648 (-),score=107.25 TRINITY_DN26817_c0_g1_i1:105-1949(-)